MSSAEGKRSRTRKRAEGKPKAKPAASEPTTDPSVLAATEPTEQPTEERTEESTEQPTGEELVRAQVELEADAAEPVHAVADATPEESASVESAPPTLVDVSSDAQTDEPSDAELAARSAGDAQPDATAAATGAHVAAADLSRDDQKKLLESLVFVSDSPVGPQHLGRMLKLRNALVRELLEELSLEYQSRGIQLVELAGGFQFRSAPGSAHYVRDVVAQPPVRLTRAQLETLALVAYRQPITRPEIDDVRGVDSGSALRVLLERGLLKMLGRKDEPGRPLLYGTAPHFLEFFGMRSLKDLPTLREFTELSDENRALFQRKTGETIEEAEAALLAAEEVEPQDAPAVQDQEAPASSANDAGEGTELPASEYSSIEETATEETETEETETEETETEETETEETETAADPAAAQDVEEADEDSTLQAGPLQDDDDIDVDAETHADTHADADEDRAEADITTRVEP